MDLFLRWACLAWLSSLPPLSIWHPNFSFCPMKSESVESGLACLLACLLTCWLHLVALTRTARGRLTSSSPFFVLRFVLFLLPFSWLNVFFPYCFLFFFFLLARRLSPTGLRSRPFPPISFVIHPAPILSTVIHGGSRPYPLSPYLPTPSKRMDLPIVVQVPPTLPTRSPPKRDSSSSFVPIVHLVHFVPMISTTTLFFFCLFILIVPTPFLHYTDRLHRTPLHITTHHRIILFLLLPSIRFALPLPLSLPYRNCSIWDDAYPALVRSLAPEGLLLSLPLACSFLFFFLFVVLSSLWAHCAWPGCAGPAPGLLWTGKTCALFSPPHPCLSLPSCRRTPGDCTTYQGTARVEQIGPEVEIFCLF